MSVGILGLLVLLALLAVIGIPMIGGLIKVFFGSRDGGGISTGRATLNCPHCQHETPTGPPTCEHCGCEL